MIAGGASLARYAVAVEDLLADHELLQADLKLQVYFDTSDVRDALLGMDAFYDNAGQFRRPQFDSTRSLVQCLAGAGSLGSIAMVTPHQAELVSLLRFEFGQSVASNANRATIFWADAGVLPEEGRSSVDSLSSLSHERVAEIIRQQTGAAATFFKAVRCIAGTWQMRLRDWTTRQVLLFEKSAENLVAILSSDAFHQYRSVFDEVRPEHPLNNRADAAALTILEQKTEDFRSGRSLVFPCFYAAQLFATVVSRTAREDAFTVTLPSGRKTSSLRSTDYFLLKGIQGTAGNREPFLDITELRRLSDDLQAIVHEPREDLREYAGRTSLAISPLVNELTDLAFFDRVWLPYAAINEATAALQLLEESRQIFAAPDMRREITAALHRVQQELHRNASRYKTILELSERLRSAYDRLGVELERGLELPGELTVILGLSPFGLAPHTRTRVSDIIRRLIASDSSALAEILELYQDATSEKKAPEAAEIVCAVSWPAGMDDLVLSLSHAQRLYLGRHSLDVFFVAAALRSGRNLAQGRKVIAELESRYEAASSEVRGDLAIGLASLYGRLWRRSAEGPEDFELVSRAVNYAAAATAFVTDDARRAYALNQQLYYLVESGADISMLRAVALRLLSFKSTPIWQYRFDGTLAMFFLRRAESTEDPHERMRMLELAEQTSYRAAVAAPFDPEIQMTRALIQIRRDEMPRFDRE